MAEIETTTQRLREEPKTWLVTGVAGFIGSNLLETLLGLNQTVVGIDDFSTGKRANLADVRQSLEPKRWERFRLVEGNVSSADVCNRAVRGVDIVLHQAALGSVPRSIEEPLLSNDANVTGHLTLLEAARNEGTRRFVYASSSAVYGDDPGLPKVEDRLGSPLSPYAATKLTNELYAGVYGKLHGLETVGLRYFNVFGRRQDPEGAYAAVIPCWIAAMIRGGPVHINGTGETSRDFCHVANVVQANLLAATVERPEALNQAYNVALGFRTTLGELFELLRDRLVARHPHLAELNPEYGPFRSGDVMHSQASIEAARRLLQYEPTHSLELGLDQSLSWYEGTLA